MKQPIATSAAPAAIGAYSQAIRAGEFLFVSGQLPIDPATGAFPSDDVVEQARRSLANVVAIVEAAGGTVASVVKTTVLLSDIGDFAAVNEEYAKVFASVPPARAAYQVAALPKGAKIEIEAIAYIDTP